MVFGMLVVAALCLGDSPLAESPYAKSKVGDSVSHKMTTSGSPQPIITIKTVTAKNDDSVTLKIETKFGDFTSPPQETKIDLKAKPTPPPEKTMAPEVKKLGAGNEKLTIGGKSYDCAWTHNQSTATIEGKKYVTVAKVWTCKDVPLEGLVRAETETNGQKTVVELIDAKTGK